MDCNNPSPLPTFETVITVSAAHCSPQQELTLPRLVQEIIDIATRHADLWNVGYERLIQQNAAWVLSRLSLRLHSPLKVKHSYKLTTWVDSLNRHFTRRLVSITDTADDTTVAEAVTIWAAIDIGSRRSVDLQQWADDMAIGVFKPVVPIDFEPPRLNSIAEPDAVREYKVEYSDLDFNCHVTTTRYIQLLLNHWPADFYNKNRITGLHVAFMAETRADSLIKIESVGNSSPTMFRLTHGDTVALRAEIETIPINSAEYKDF